MALAFPSSPTNGQIYNQYVYSTSIGAWQNQNDPTNVANLITGKANLAGGNTFTGYQLNSSNPFFSASKTGGWETVNPNTPVVFNSAQINIGGHYNTSNGRFTAPVSGRYVFHFSFYVDGARQISFRKNGSDYIPTDTALAVSIAGSHTLAGSYLFNLSAGDYVEAGCRSGSVSLYFYSGHTWFMGYMVG